MNCSILIFIDYNQYKSDIQLSEVTMNLQSLDTPALLIDRIKLNVNIDEMAELCSIARVKLRPHIKTHKIGEIALTQNELSGNGIAVAKLSEAEVMIDIGISDILIANQIIGEKKIVRLSRLARSSSIKLCVDSKVGIDQLERYLNTGDKKLELFIEIDTGMKRAGLTNISEVIELVRYINKSRKLTFIGLMSHSGNIYGAENRAQVIRIAAGEIIKINSIAESLRESGVTVKEISVGSTPSALYLTKAKGITEFRPGNYIFNDNIQISLGVTPVDKCALTVMATVISRPTRDRIIIDAGSKCLGLDRGVHGSQLITGYGLIREHPSAIIERLSEEHGIIRVREDNPLRIGDRITIIPNHACSVTNLFDLAYVIEQDRVVNSWQIIARGKVT